MEKRCTRCGIIKLFSDFTLNSNRPDKLTVWCKVCSKQSRDDYYLKNKDKIKEKHLEWRVNNKDYISSQRNIKKEEDPRKSLLYAAKYRATHKGLPFDIELDDIVIPEYCPVLNIKLEFFHSSQNRTSPSLDRIDSNLGYTKDNIQVISWLANTMKTNATKDELLLFANWVLNTFKENNDRQYLQKVK